MSVIDSIEDNYTENDNWFGTFECPNCNQDWGPSNQGDPPADVVELVKCTCGAILRVSGEWVSNYTIDAEIMDDE